ncbi:MULTISPECIES: transporter [Ensifer]|jgi:undecaprenyl phosphate-alpha-L-ara4N flippase subunit ArnE|uniref:Transporter n=1 Tax=Ensifer adhaerens TaxID=106592 RepID=A0A9Q9D962_ENSAD|nr:MULTISPECIES: transporter [Ensifer]USJ23318.1 transporter [Ensifer adhaerens]UTV36648.1 transporter [Ensifer adhaerens]SDM26846.1 undecaprenyl phosphate-alpha-L-ara4N flippase subunit ArnE [Ensifer sp. YR511]
MAMNLNLTPTVWFGLFFTPVLISAGQILFKLTSAKTGNASAQGLLALALSPTLLIALAVYGIGTIIWIFTIKSVPLTIAYSFMGLTFCIVPLLAAVFLGEAVTLRYAFGAALIISGMIIINS